MIFCYLFAKLEQVTTDYFSYIPLVIVRECGYGLQFVKCRVFKKSLIDKVNSLPLNAKIICNYRTVKRGKFIYNNITLIEEYNFSECSKCSHPITDMDSDCTGCESIPAQKIDGECVIVEKNYDENGIKYVLDCSSSKMIFTLFNNNAKYAEWSQMQKGDIVNAKGWLADEQFARLRIVERIQPSDMDI